MSEKAKASWMAVIVILGVIAGGAIDGDNMPLAYILMLLIAANFIGIYVVDNIIVKRTEESKRFARYVKARNMLLDMATHGYDITECLACVYDLYQEGLITEDEEQRLYHDVDPKALWNDVAAYWYNFSEKNPLFSIYCK